MAQDSLLVEIMVLGTVSAVATLGTWLYKRIKGSKPESSEQKNAESTVPCPKCGFSYKYDGVNCRHCGYPNRKPKPTTRKESNTIGKDRVRKPKKSMQTVRNTVLGCLLFMAIGVGLLLLARCLLGEYSAEDKHRRDMAINGKYALGRVVSCHASFSEVGTSRRKRTKIEYIHYVQVVPLRKPARSLDPKIQKWLSILETSGQAYTTRPAPLPIGTRISVLYKDEYLSSGENKTFVFGGVNQSEEDMRQEVAKGQSIPCYVYGVFVVSLLLLVGGPAVVVNGYFVDRKRAERKRRRQIEGNGTCE